MASHTQNVVRSVVVLLGLCAVGQPAMAVIALEGGQSVVFDGSVESIGDYYIVGNWTPNNSVQLVNGASVASDSHVVAGYYQPSCGNSITLAGGSVWTHNGGATIGSNGHSNSLLIEGGSELLTGGVGYVGLGVGANYNTATVTGTGSVWDIADGLFVGGFDDNRVGTKHYGNYNRVTVADGATIVAPQLRTYVNNTLSLVDATVETLGGVPLDLMGAEEFSGTNTLVLQCDSLADLADRNLTLMTGLDSPSLIETFDVRFRDESGTLYSATDANFAFNNGSWCIATGQDFVAADPIPEPLTAVGLLAAAGSVGRYVRRRRTN